MLDIQSFIRYAIPGYIVLTAVVLGCRNAEIESGAYMAVFGRGGATSVAFVVAGPLVGFIIQQLYFLYFDFSESYDRAQRPCLRVLSQWAEDLIDRDEAERARLAFVAWKIVMTKSTAPEAILGAGYVRALRELHAYIHSFGAAVLATLIALAIGVVSLFWAVPSVTKCLLFSITCVLLATLFAAKRRGLSHRADLLERAAVLHNRELFLDTMVELNAADTAFAPGLLTTAGRMPRLRPSSGLELHDVKAADSSSTALVQTNTLRCSTPRRDR